MSELFQHLKKRALEKLKLRKVYAIAFPCDQTLEYWTGAWPRDDKPLYTHLGKEAWRTTSKGQGEEVVRMIEASGHPDAGLCNPVWEWQLDLEDWTW